MRTISASEIDAALTFPSLMDALSEAFQGKFLAPTRHHHVIAQSSGSPATHLLMPAWDKAGDYIGVKIVNAFPDNGKLGLPAIMGTYVLQSGRTGQTLAILDGSRLTPWRTAAASGLATRYLARKNARALLIVGAGALAPFLARAHASERTIETVQIWNHRPEGARKTAEALSALGFAAIAVEDLQSAVGEADIISCATLSQAPLISGAWLKPGQHLDLVGAFNMTMREADDLALQRSRVFIDTPAALSEGGEVALGLQSGAIQRSDVVADLAALVQGAPGRGADDEITLFKSVGAAIEDLAAAILVYETAGAG
jgi:ornithine cyclodeaminase/alanine dehydrogenase-like protein (mu-crystallin family)